MNLKLLILSLFFVFSNLYAEELRVVAFNIERGYQEDATIERIQEIIKDDIGYSDLWAFSEVTHGDEDKLNQTLGSNFKVIIGPIRTSYKGTDMLGAAYNENIFNIIKSQDIPLTKETNYRRNPLALKLQHKKTNSVFWLVSVHLYRGKGDHPDRTLEAKDINNWVSQQNIPVIVIGDFNLDYSIADKTFGSKAVNELNTLKWVEPTQKIKTHCSNYNSILDFAFVSEYSWSTKSTIINMECDDNTINPDHRPIELILNIKG